MEHIILFKLFKLRKRCDGVQLGKRIVVRDELELS